MGSRKKQTIGYHYKWAQHFGWCRGVVDAFLEYRAGGVTAWSGRLTSSGRISIKKPNLWGGEEGEGGVVGDVDVMFGEPTQAPNDYLASTFGPEQSGHRGKLTTVFRGGRFGAFVPNPKPVAAKVERILTDWADGAVWYPEKAAVGVTAQKAIALYMALDVSGSMATITSNGQTRLANMKTAVAATLDFVRDSVLSVGGRVDLQLVAWAASSSSFVDRSVDLAGIEAAKAWVAARGLVGGTNFAAGLEGMSTFFAGAQADAAQLVIFVTDGEPDNPGQTPSEIAAAAKLLVEAQPGAQVYALNIDLANTQYTAMVDNTPADGVPVVAGSDPSALTAVVVGALSGLRGMNPAHMLYESISHPDMQGEPVGVINDASFRAAADRLFSEGFGLCTTYDSDAETAQQFQQRICDVIGAVLSQSRIDGQYYLDLVRGGQNLVGLPIIGEADDDIIEFRQEPSAVTEAVNVMRVEWFDPQAKEDRVTAPLGAQGHIRSSGEQIPETRVYPEIPAESLALRVCKRDLKAGATPLSRFRLTIRPRFRRLRPGQYFRLQAPSEGIADMVCLIGSVEHGTQRDGRMKIVAVQDVYTMPETVHIEPEPGLWTPPSTVPLPSPHQRAFEAPYVELAATLPAAELAELAPDLGFVVTAATRPAGALNYEVATSAAGLPFESKATADWCPSALIVEGGGRTATVFTLASMSDLDLVSVGSWALWEDEICRVDALDGALGTATLARGCADTVPAVHPAGTRIYFCGDWVGSDPQEYVDGETVAAKLLTRLGAAVLPLESAMQLDVALAGRAARPYPPARLRIGGESEPTAVSGSFAVTWAHRDRVLQQDQLLEAEAASVGPEPETFYCLRFTDAASGTTLAEKPDIGADTATAGLAFDGEVRMVLYSQRGALESWQRVERVFSYTRAPGATVSTIEATTFTPTDVVIDAGEVTPP